MKAVIVAVLPWFLSALTIYMTVLAGNRHRHAWLIALGGQAVWLVWIVASGSWGLLPMNVALWVVYTRNHLKWSRPRVSDPHRPIAPLSDDVENLPLWDLVNALFVKYGAAPPPGRLRDELVNHLQWARWAKRLAANGDAR